MEKILLFQTEASQTAQIKRLAGNKKIRVIMIEKSDLGSTLGELADGVKTPGQMTVPEKSLMVFCHVSEKHLDRILFELRDKKIHVDYKAVLTDTNRNWLLPQLYQELEWERRAMGQG